MHQKHTTASESKRKRQNVHNNDTNVSRSFSQLSISQNDPKKQKTENNNQQRHKVSKGMNNDNKQEKKNEDADNSDDAVTTNYLQTFKPRYLRVSDKQFKQMLSDTIKDTNDTTIQSLDTKEKLQLARQITEVTNNLQYFNLQKQLWQDYYNISLKDENGIWAPRLSKTDAKEHHTCYSCGFPKHIIEKRQKTIEHQLKRTTDELNQHLIQLHTLTDQWRPAVDPNILSDAINQLVANGQQRLRAEFDHRRKMLELDFNDRHLITEFYQLKPNDEQVSSKQIVAKFQLSYSHLSFRYI